MQILKDPESDPEISEMLRRLDLLEFHSAYSSLTKLLARLRRSIHTQVAFATPPGQTTIPEDPNRSGDSTSSNSSTESKPEPYAQNVATNFLTATHSTVGKWMRCFEWVNPEVKLYLSPQYASVFVVLIVAVLSRKWKYVSARRSCFKRSMTAEFPCTFDAIQHRVNNPDA